MILTGPMVLLEPGVGKPERTKGCCLDCYFPFMQPPKCPKCAAEMEPGFVIDKGMPGSGSSSIPEWADGVPERSIWTAVKLRGHERHPVSTFRCSRCGYLESYATSS